MDHLRGSFSLFWGLWTIRDALCLKAGVDDTSNEWSNFKRV